MLVQPTATDQLATSNINYSIVYHLFREFAVKLTDKHTKKPVLSGRSKIDKTKVLKINCT